MSTSNSLAASVLAAVKSDLDAGFIYGFAGPVPADADDPLDMVNDHTQVLKFSVNNDGVTGLTFDPPVGTAMSKAASETWEGLVAFDGAQAAEEELTPTFYRFCQAADDGRGAGTTPRLQGTMGGPSDPSAGIQLDTSTVIANGSNTKGIGIYNVTAAQVG